MCSLTQSPFCEHLLCVNLLNKKGRETKLYEFNVFSDSVVTVI